MLGLDDVREISAWGKNWRQTMETQPALPVHLSPACMRHVERVFPYLCTKPDESKGEVVRMVSQLNFNVVREDAPSFSVGGLEISALPVLSRPKTLPASPQVLDRRSIATRSFTVRTACATDTILASLSAWCTSQT
jgi:hypothetical protein